jgi:ADP-heptose:LPS heptosyltransferase
MWKTKNFPALADMLIDRCKVQIVILGSPGERDVMAEMKQLLYNPAHMAPQMTFNEAGALLKRSHLLICNDGGLNHLSVAMDTPSLAIFGNTKIIDRASELFPGHICLHNPSHNSLKDDSFGISPDTAFDSAIKLLNPEDEIRKI